MIEQFPIKMPWNSLWADMVLMAYGVCPPFIATAAMGFPVKGRINDPSRLLAPRKGDV